MKIKAILSCKIPHDYLAGLVPIKSINYLSTFIREEMDGQYQLYTIIDIKYNKKEKPESFRVMNLHSLLVDLFLADAKVYPVEINLTSKLTH